MSYFLTNDFSTSRSFGVLCFFFVMSLLTRSCINKSILQTRLKYISRKLSNSKCFLVRVKWLHLPRQASEFPRRVEVFSRTISYIKNFMYVIWQNVASKLVLWQEPTLYLKKNTVALTRPQWLTSKAGPWYSMWCYSWQASDASSPGLPSWPLPAANV